MSQFLRAYIRARRALLNASALWFLMLGLMAMARWGVLSDAWWMIAASALCLLLAHSRWLQVQNQNDEPPA